MNKLVQICEDIHDDIIYYHKFMCKANYSHTYRVFVILNTSKTMFHKLITVYLISIFFI